MRYCIMLALAVLGVVSLGADPLPNTASTYTSRAVVERYDASLPSSIPSSFPATRIDTDDVHRRVILSPAALPFFAASVVANDVRTVTASAVDSSIAMSLTHCDDYVVAERANGHDSRPLEVISISPMPSTGPFTVRTTLPSDGTLMIVDLAGVVVMRYDGPVGPIVWSTSLSIGMYRVVLVHRDGMVSVPLVILP